MPKLSLSEPLGLPEGSIRGLLALILGSATAGMWFMQIPVSAEQLVLTTAVMTYYFSKRQADDTSPPEVFIPEKPV